jgi:RNA polymerase sigma-70 factor, ECF subfamily
VGSSVAGYTDFSDEALVEAANRGDVGAFEAIYYRYRDWVVRLAFRIAGNHVDALDVLQETFAYLFRKLPEVRLTARMTTFLYPVVKNLSIAARRKATRHTPGDEALADVAAEETERTSRDELAIVVGALSEGQRDVLLLRFVDGLSLAEIGATLGIPLGTVKSRLHNALDALRRDERTREYFLS